MSRHHSVVGIGSLWQLHNQAEALRLDIPKLTVTKNLEHIDGPGVYWFDPAPNVANRDARDLSEAERGKLAVAALSAVPSRMKGPLSVLTAPINKKNAALAGFSFPGQTEYFEHLWGANAVMLLAGPLLRVALVTNHMGLRDVSDAISEDLILRKIKIINDSMKSLFGLHRPRIAVCGLNPHCGDDGLFGCEDDEITRPAVKAAKDLNIFVEGPVPADTVFYRAMQGEFDVVLAMYHDQGLSALKTVHFDDAVNISLGLPYLRVSPDHGPAANLFLSGRASMRSFDAALKVCERWMADHYGT
jgi:4-hydroxythreonine-4-phosphate dehydrogenase